MPQTSSRTCVVPTPTRLRLPRTYLNTCRISITTRILRRTLLRSTITWSSAPATISTPLRISLSALLERSAAIRPYRRRSLIAAYITAYRPFLPAIISTFVYPSRSSYASPSRLPEPLLLERPLPPPLRPPPRSLRSPLFFGASSFLDSLLRA